MKIKIVAANLLLAASLTLTACGDAVLNNPVGSASSGTTTVETVDIKEPGILETKFYSLVYLDGNVYLATACKASTDVDCYTSYKFYDARTEEYIGKGIYITKEDAEQSARQYAFNTSYKGFDDFNENYADKKFQGASFSLENNDAFTGEYGYGNVIPGAAIIPLKTFVDTTYPTREQFDFFASNSEELKGYIQENWLLNNREYDRSSYTFRARYRNNFEMLIDLVTLEISEVLEASCEMLISQYECTKDDNSVDVFFGYRISPVTSDKGYYQIYDVISGKVIFIGDGFLGSYKEVKETAIKEGLTPKILSGESISVSGIGESASVEIDDASNEEEMRISLPSIPVAENKNIYEETLAIDSIYVFSTNKGTVTSVKDGDEKVSYRVTYEVDCQQGDEIMPFNIFLDYYNMGWYRDFMHDAYAIPLLNNEGMWYETNDSKTAFNLRGLSMVSFREFLIYNDLEDLIKDTYTVDEIADIYYKFNKVIDPRRLALD